MNSEIEKITTQIIQQNFDLPEITFDENALNKIRELLIDKLDFLLDHDFEKLLWTIYRIDVNEEKAKAALAVSSIQKPSEVLADLIIERQMEKAKTRLLYKTEDGDL